MFDAPIGDRRSRNENIGGQRRLDGGQHFARAFNAHRLDASGVCDANGSADKRHSCACPRGRLSDGVTLLAGRTIADEPDGIDGFMSWAGGHEHMLADQPAVRFVRCAPDPRGQRDLSRSG